MTTTNAKLSTGLPLRQSQTKSNESGAALATAILMLALLGAIAMTVLAVVRTETRHAGSDLKRTQTFYASAAGIEKMTNDFSALYQNTSRPSDDEVAAIAELYPSELIEEGFTLEQSAVTDNVSLASMRTTQGLASPALPRVTMPSDSAFAGLLATVKPYTLTSTATALDGTQVSLTRNMNNYMIPLFQFGMFSDTDIELHPGTNFTFNGRVHANGNVYVAGKVVFLDKVTSAHELLYDKMRNGAARGSASEVFMSVGPTAISVPLTKGSMNGGPHIAGQTDGQPNFFPFDPEGFVWDPATFVWKITSKQNADGTANKFGGQLLTRTTGASTLQLPMQLDGNPTREIIKRRMPNDSVPDADPPSALSESRYHTKARIRILIDDEGVDDVAGLDGTQNGDGTNTHSGITLSTFNPIPLPNSTVAGGGGRALWRLKDNNTDSTNSYDETTTSFVQQMAYGTPIQADTVRGVRVGPPLKTISAVTTASPMKVTANGHGFSTGDEVFISGVSPSNMNANGKFTITKVDDNNFRLNGTSTTRTYSSGGTVYSVTALAKSPNGIAIPGGAGLTGRILIQIVDSDGDWHDVTTEILSMGVTVGEPNAILHLQRPLWAAFTQGSRDGSTNSTTPNAGLNGDSAYANHLTDIINKTRIAADGEVTSSVNLADPGGYLTGIVDDTASGAQPRRSDVLPTLSTSSFSSSMWNCIVPINVYNVREGRLTTSTASPNLTSDANKVYQRGVTNVVEINMKNLSRWLDGVFDKNLLASTNAVSTNIENPGDGYVVYISDRRGDNVKSVYLRDPETDEFSTTTSEATNGMADNVDIYGPNGTLQNGEDVQETGEPAGSTLVKDTAELPDPAELGGTSNATDFTSRRNRAFTVAALNNPSTSTSTTNYFRRSVRLFNAETLQTSGAPRAKLSTTVGVTISTENMVYTWGNYNTDGIDEAPDAGKSSYNDPTKKSHYMPTSPDKQVPSSIVADAWFPLSKTWSDSFGAIHPDTLASRPADRVASGTLAVTQETSVRVGIIAGNNLGAIAGTPDAGNSSNGESRLNGGMHNFPRFLEDWSGRFNFVGALIPLYRSTQALGQYNNNSTIYDAPGRNWAFDITFRNYLRLPPGTPQFQHIEATGFRQIL